LFFFPFLLCTSPWPKPVISGAGCEEAGLGVLCCWVPMLSALTELPFRYGIAWAVEKEKGGIAHHTDLARGYTKSKLPSY